jgi:hypothetical protein
MAGNGTVPMAKPDSDYAATRRKTLRSSHREQVSESDVSDSEPTATILDLVRTAN